MNVMKRKTEAPNHASKSIVLEVNTEKIEYILIRVRRHQYSGQIHNIKIANEFLEMCDFHIFGNKSNCMEPSPS
jgi:hypothetical protein